MWRIFQVSRNTFLMLYSINWPNFILWLPLLLEILKNLCIAVIYCPVSDIMNFEVNHSFLIKPFLHVINNSEQKYLKNEKSL